MPVAVSYPGVYIEEVASGVRAISGVATSVALFVGWAARGPIDSAVRVASFSDYEHRFGGLDRRTLLGHAVQQFFDNGGSDAHVLRLPPGDEVAAVCTLGALTITASSPGAWANDSRVRLTARSDDASRFNLDVLHHPSKDAVVERFQNLTMRAGDPRFVESVVNEASAFVAVSAGSAVSPGDGVVDLAAGADGTVRDASDPDFRAALLARFGPGTITDHIDLFNIVCVPGLVEPTTIAALQRHCHDRRAFLIVDGPENLTVATAPAALAGLAGAGAQNSAFFFPWVRASDPLQPGVPRNFPPCGFVAGVFARTDSSRGVWKAPSGIDADIIGAAGVSITINDTENGLLNPRGINCLRTMPNCGTVVWGARTLWGGSDRASEWKYVSVRRTALFLEETICRGVQWAMFEPNGEALWAQIRLNVGAFMQNLFRQGAFQGKLASEAYFVECDSSTTTQADIKLGRFNIVVGFAPQKPAEFVVLRLQQTAGQVEG